MDKESLLITKNNAIGFAFYLKNNNNPTIYIAHQTLIPYESYDNGATWNPIHFILSNLQEPPVFHFNDVIEGRAVSLDGNSLYTISTYNKTDWKSVKPNISLKDISQINLQNDGIGWIFVKGQIMITSDGGKTWTKP